jgi:hypothetical protein
MDWQLLGRGEMAEDAELGGVFGIGSVRLRGCCEQAVGKSALRTKDYIDAICATFLPGRPDWIYACRKIGSKEVRQGIYSGKS